MQLYNVSRIVVFATYY